MSYGYPPPQPGQQPPSPPFPSAPDPSQGAPYQHWPQPGPGGYGYPQPPKKSRTGLIVTLSVVGGTAALLALGVLIAVLGSDDSPSGDSKRPVAEASDGRTPAKEGEGTPAPDDASDASAEPPAREGTDGTGDVRITRCAIDSLTEWPDADVEIVNRSEDQASYIVSVEFVDGEGTRRASGLAAATDLAAGQKAVEKAQGLGKVPGRMTCRVSKVTRLPSS
ncbi:hypothetical protein [Streptomyces sp. ML-6]|uniref:hypothetical protein n=1 Tax=Streptomyces sp. ML-6 TaxID=2982693 RepID=UPI0024C0574C|nr:hypothetical protein [Streptomyces sp. ML-6]MDK0519268.1 hypothetical protein [Streptomyces sp. ML-6]